MDGDSVSIRMLRITGQETTRTFARTSTIANVIESLQNDWPAAFGTLNAKSEVKFIHGGKFLEPTKTLADLRFSSSEPTTVHVIVKDGLPQRAADVNGLNNDAHLHGMLFDEEEFLQTNQIFARLTNNPDGKMRFAQLEAFLKKYWAFIMIGQYIPAHQVFPQQQLESLWKKVSRSDNLENAVDLGEFRTMFFMFTTTGHDDPCVHGSRARVLEAAQQFHAQLKAQFSELPSFQQAQFDTAFDRADLDHDGNLTCAECELLFHLYSCAVIENSHLPDAKIVHKADRPMQPASAAQ